MTRAALLAGLLALAGCGPAFEGPRHVVVIVLDATHGAHLSCAGGPPGLTPNLDRVAARGRRFAAAFSNTTWTLPSTTSLLTGLLPERHGVLTDAHRAPESLVTLAERFAAAGRATAAFVQMVYASHLHGLDQGFERYVFHRSQDPAAARTLAELEEHVAALDATPTFTYVHLRRPHAPYDPAPDVRARVCGDCPLCPRPDPIELALADGLGQRTLPPRERAHVVHLYQANLATVDAQLGPLLDRLLARDDTLIVVTSDHGEALGQDGWYGHGAGLTAAEIDVPLLVAGPGVAPGVDAEPACTVDLFPTLLDLCGLAPPEGVVLDGRSLAPRLRGEPTPPRQAPIPLVARFYDGAPSMFGAVLGEHKLIVTDQGPARLLRREPDAAPLAADLAQPPTQRADLEASLLRFCQEWRARHADAASGGERVGPLAPEDLAELKQLGYVR